MCERTVSAYLICTKYAETTDVNQGCPRRAGTHGGHSSEGLLASWPPVIPRRGVDGEGDQQRLLRASPRCVQVSLPEELRWLAGVGGCAGRGRQAEGWVRWVQLVAERAGVP